MSVDEYAAFEKSKGVSVTCVGGMWWRSVRSFFYRPLIPFVELAPNTMRYPLLHVIGGVQHGVAHGHPVNSTLNYFIYDQLQDYAVKSLPKDLRWHIKRGLKNFTIRPIIDEAEFIEQAYPCYLSFYKRTQYAHRADRRQQRRFTQWARNLFRFPKTLKLGAYQDGKLAAVLVSCFVENDIHLSTYFSDTAYLKLSISDALFHAVRELAAMTTAEHIFVGWHSGIKGLDEFKVLRGCKLIEKPAYFKINGLALYLLKHFRSSEYQKLVGFSCGTFPAQRAG